jgi:LacI family transcriptional regulator
MPSNDQLGSIQADFIAKELIRPLARVLNVQDEAGYPRIVRWTQHLHTDRCFGEGSSRPNQLLVTGIVARRKSDTGAADRYGAGPVISKIFEGKRGLLKTFSENHLAVDACVNFVIHVLEAGTRTEIGRNRVADLTRWSVFIEQHELGTPPPAWLTDGSWDGILSRPTDHAMARLFRRMKVPVVDLNDLYEDLGLPWVGSDHSGIGRMGAAHLLEKGFRNFAFCGFAGELWSRQRCTGFFSVARPRAAHTSVYETPWRGPDTPRWDQDIEQIEKWILSLPKPVAIMACNDVRGLHVLDACSRAGVIVPEEVAVLGVDDEDTMCELCSPPLSSVAPNPEGIGYAAAELLQTLMSGQTPQEDRISVSPIRVSCRQSTDTMAVTDWAVASAARYMRELALQGCRVDDVLEKVHMSRRIRETFP